MIEDKSPTIHIIVNILKKLLLKYLNALKTLVNFDNL